MIHGYNLNKLAPLMLRGIMSHTLTWESSRLLRVFTGNLSGDELFESNLNLQQDKRFEGIKSIINDFTLVKSHSITPEHIEVSASTDEVISKTKHNLKIALVVPKGPLQSLASRYCKLMQGQLFECAIFTSIEDANNWCV